jgi:hypothetical protein
MRQERTMAVNAIGATASRRVSEPSRIVEEEAAPTAPRTLVPVPAFVSQERPWPLSRRPAAPFLAHLIATACGEPQTRARSRTKPEAAAQAYAATAAQAYAATAALNNINVRK